MKLTTITAIFLALYAHNNPVFAKDGNPGHSSLPPGLEKRYHQGKPLPPGWQKKFLKGDILDHDIYVRGRVVVPLGKDGILSISVDGTLIKLVEATREIIDIAY